MRHLRRALAASLALAFGAPIVGIAGAGTASAAPAAATTRYSLPGGRTYLLHAGPVTGTPRPLIVALHAANHTAASMEQLSGLSPYANTHGLVVAYGEGRNGRWNAGACCSATNPDDVDYLRTLVADTARRTPIALSSVYVTGYSNGGMMAWRASCEAPDVFVAAAVVAGALLVPCTGTTVRAYHIHGLTDATVPLAGGRGFEGHVFPDSRTEPVRVGPGSLVRQYWWSGGHGWPNWTTDTVVPWLLRFARLPGRQPPRHIVRFAGGDRVATVGAADPDLRATVGAGGSGPAAPVHLPVATVSLR